MRLFRAHGSVELGQVASGSATQGLWLGNRKVGSQVIGKDEADSLEEERLGNLGGKKDEEEKPVIE